jgi:hypothetical protein
MGHGSQNHLPGIQQHLENRRREHTIMDNRLKVEIAQQSLSDLA